MLRCVPIARLLMCAVGLLTLTGCATFEFDIVKPPAQQRHVGHDQEQVVNAGPLEYRMLAVEDYLVVRIFNRSAATFQFLGEHSAVVDPTGQSHALRGMTLPPGSHMKLVLPPVPHIEPTGPRIGFGIGVGFSRGYYGAGWGDGLGRTDLLWDQPRYVAIYDTGEEPWKWPADSEARMLLTFQSGADKPFTQEWTFRKRRM